MSAEIAAAVFLIAVPIAFNLAFFELGRTFNYPNILREPADVILRRFAAGGTPLLLRWQALLVSALAMLPLVALLAVAIPASPVLAILGAVIGSAAALVQVLGLVRWPFAVPELARRYVDAEGRMPPPPARRSKSSSPPSIGSWASASENIWGICSPVCGPSWSPRRRSRRQRRGPGWDGSACRSALRS